MMLVNHIRFDFVSRHIHCINPTRERVNASLFLTDYAYYDYTTEAPAGDVDYSLDDWVYDLLDLTGK